MRSVALFFAGGAFLVFALGEFLIYFGLMMGFACPGCGLRDPSVWRYTVLPWFGGATLLAVAGWLYHRASFASPSSSIHLLPSAGRKRRLYLTILGSFCCAAAILFLLFIVFIAIAALRH